MLEPRKKKKQSSFHSGRPLGPPPVGEHDTVRLREQLLEIPPARHQHPAGAARVPPQDSGCRAARAGSVGPAREPPRRRRRDPGEQRRSAPWRASARVVAAAMRPSPTITGRDGRPLVRASRPSREQILDRPGGEHVVAVDRRRRRPVSNETWPSYVVQAGGGLFRMVCGIGWMDDPLSSCIARKISKQARFGEKPHSSELTVKTMSESMKYRLRPITSASHPLTGSTIALAAR